MSSMYAPRSTLCVPDNACSLAMISTVIVVSSESEKLFSCVMVISENVDVEAEFTLTSNASENDVLTTSVSWVVCPFSKVICFLSMSIENGGKIDVSTTPILFSTHSVHHKMQSQIPVQLHNNQFPHSQPNLDFSKELYILSVFQ